MATVVRREKQQRSLNSWNVPYFVQDEAGLDLEDAVAAVLAQGLVDQGVPSNDYQLDELSVTAARVRLVYQSLEEGGPLAPPTAGSLETGFDWQIEPVDLIYTRQRIAKFPGPSDPGGPAPDFAFAIHGWDGYPAKPVGLKLGAPPQMLWKRYTFSSDVITDAYLATLMGLCGTVNNGEYFNMAAGQLLVVRASVRQVMNQVSQLDLGWAFQRNVTGRTFPKADGGQFGPFNHDGFDYVWTWGKYGIGGDTGNEYINQYVDYVYVDRIFPRGSYNNLLPVVP